MYFANLDRLLVGGGSLDASESTQMVLAQLIQIVEGVFMRVSHASEASREWSCD